MAHRSNSSMGGFVRHAALRACTAFLPLMTATIVGCGASSDDRTPTVSDAGGDATVDGSAGDAAAAHDSASPDGGVVGDASSSDGQSDASLFDAGAPVYSCTKHVTPATFAASVTAAAANDVLCLAPGDYGAWTGAAKTGRVVLTPDASAGANAPTGNATGGADGNVRFGELAFVYAAFLTLDGITFTDDVGLSWGNPAGNVHDITLRRSLFHAHLQINDTAMTNANILIDFNSFPGDKADCINGPEGRIQLSNSNHAHTADGVVIQNNNIGGVPTVQCDGVQSGGFGTQIVGNWFHGYHYQNAAHTDGIQLYGAESNVIRGNFFYDVPDGIVAYDGMSNHDIENNVVVNDSAKNNGASPNQFDFLANTGTSTIKHNTVVGGLDSYHGPEGVITLGTKGDACTGLVVNDNVATSISNGSGGGNCAYSADYNLLQQGGGTGAHNTNGAPMYRGGDCGNLTVDPPGTCAGVWSNFLLTATSPGHLAAEDGTDVGAFGAGPRTPGGTVAARATNGEEATAVNSRCTYVIRANPG